MSVIGTFLIPCAIMVYTNARVVRVMRKNERARRNAKYRLTEFHLITKFEQLPHKK